MLKIKLSRVGKKKQPIYRILVMEHTKDPWGNYLENVGTYNPLTNPATVALKEDRIKHWMSQGAQPTDSVHNILVEAGLIKDKKRNVSKLGKAAKTAIKEAEEKAKEEAKAKAEAEKAAKEAAEAPVETPAETETPAEPTSAEAAADGEKKDETAA